MSAPSGKPDPIDHNKASDAQKHKPTPDPLPLLGSPLLTSPLLDSPQLDNPADPNRHQQIKRKRCPNERRWMEQRAAKTDEQFCQKG